MTQPERIIELLKNKDYYGLDLLIDDYGISMMKTIQGILNHPIEKNYQEEVFNDSLYKIWLAVETYTPELSSFATWTTTITKHTAIDKKRMLQRYYREIISEKPLKNLEKNDDLLAKELFIDLITILSKEDQNIFIDYYFYQDSVEIISKKYHLSNHVIHARLSRGRKKLKKLGRDYYD